MKEILFRNGDTTLAFREALGREDNAKALIKAQELLKGKNVTEADITSYLAN